MDLDSYSRDELLKVIEKLSENLGKKAKDIIRETLDSFPKRPGIYLKFEDEKWIMELSFDGYKALIGALKKGKCLSLGACCGQTQCYVCKRYGGEIFIDGSSLKVEFNENIPR